MFFIAAVIACDLLLIFHRLWQ